MTTSHFFEEERIGQLIGLVEPAPEAWVRAAQQIPELYRSLDEIVARAEADEASRSALIAELEAAVAEAGAREPRLAEALRRYFL
jgi:hypothetical protein